MQKEDADDGGMLDHDGSQEQPRQSFGCGRCPLEFKSEVSLLEHLGHVHGSRLVLNPDPPKSPPGSSLGGLRADPPEALNDVKDGEKGDVTPKPEAETAVVSSEHHEEVGADEDEEEDDDEENLLSCPSRGTPTLHRDLKTYKKALQSSGVSKSSTGGDGQADTESEEQSDGRSDDDSKDAAPAAIDLWNSHRFLREDHLYVDPMRPVAEAPGRERGRAAGAADKRAREGLDKKELSFEVSEDDDDKRPSPPAYGCKHCGHKERSLGPMTAHYHKSHPYVRCNSEYIRERDDASATFRCLACPVEFPEESHLRKHYGERHAGCPDIFTLGRDQMQLLFKCFSCAFTSESLEALKEHHRDGHPAAAPLNGLMFLQYLSQAPSACAASYQCRRCPFRHRSVIVLQVHYQKNHPAEAVTIDEIKRRAGEDRADLARPEFPTGDCRAQRRSGEAEAERATRGEARTNAKDAVGKAQSPGPRKVPAESLEAEAPERPPEQRIGKGPPAGERAATAKKSQSGARNLYGRPENLFFCFKCNYGNPSVKGVMVHQFRTHDKLRVSAEDIAAYTGEIRRRLRTSAAPGAGGSFSPPLPLPILNEGDEHTFFCHLCHYRRSTVAKVVQHYARRHGGWLATPKQIQSYTFRTLELLRKSDGAADGPGGVAGGPAGPGKVESLRCQGCPYQTRDAKLWGAHVRKCRRGGSSGSGVLKVYLAQGNAASGYRCHLCAFSHAKAAALYKHYRREHPESRPNLIATREKAGRTPAEAPDAGTHRCRACSFRGSSPAAMRDHCRAVHPWCLEEGGPEGGGGERGHDALRDPFGRFDDYQVPLESPSASPERIRPLSPKRGGDDDVGGDDGDNGASKESERSVDAEEESHVHVFKCPYCTYVNTKRQGVLTHCQMRHAALRSRADNLLVDGAHLRGWEKKRRARPGHPAHFRGYMCPLCPLTHESEKKLERHRQRDHGQSRPAAPAAAKLKMTLFRCQRCAYSCSSKAAFGRHLRLKHEGPPAPALCRYRCVLCSQSYLKKKRLAGHYKSKHGQDAYRRHFLPLYERPPPQHSRRLVYRCPRCPYVNSRPHGMATHCQMMHADLSVQVEDLGRHEMLISSNYQAGSNNKRGYVCASCQAICTSLKKLAVHRAKRHADEDAGDSSARAEPEAPRRAGGAPASLYPCLLCSYSSLIRKRLAAHYTKRHGKKALRKHFAPLYQRKADGPPSSPSSPSPPPAAEAAEAEPPQPPPEGEQMLYECQLCEYQTWARRYLTYHYNKTHQLDPGTRDRLLMAYNKRKRPPLPRDPPPDSEPEPREAPPTAPAPCKKCPDLTFGSPQLLIAHYRASHGAGRADFAVVHPAGRNTGVYRCARCRKTLNGMAKLGRHLDRHREKSSAGLRAQSRKPADAAAREEGSPSGGGQAAVPEKAPRPEATEGPSPSETHACTQCQRTFQSRNGLRTHQRGHQALAAIKKLPASLSQLNLNKYLLHKPGTIRPFQCSICFYRTNVMGLWNNHLLKKHLDSVLETCDEKQESSATASADTDPPAVGSAVASLGKSSEGCSRGPVRPCADWYLEPPEVRRQLDHFSLMARNRAATGGLRCENCSFFCEDLPTMRRHYLSRHGRKLLACKDCAFFTGLKRAMRVHADTDHGGSRKEAPPPEGLRCPFCLYQSHDKNRMIDHVLLHREERVVPMEVRRAKLSRYLRGLVFRCHLCTYTSADADNLRAHAAKHQRLKPYRCRLCYFDCAGLADLEAHLCAQHQVMRNHELVGQVSLEQLEQLELNRTPQEERHRDEREQRLDHDNARDFFSRAEEADDGNVSGNPENRLGETPAFKRERQSDATPGDDARIPLPENRHKKEEADHDDDEGGAEKRHEKAHGSKLQTPNVEEDAPRPDEVGATRSFSSGEEPRAGFSESSGKAAKKTLKREMSAPLAGGFSEPPRDDKAHKRKICQALKEEDGPDREGQKRLKVDRFSQLKGVDLTFSCSLCGRNLRSKEEMRRHASRHGM
ncbi:zinc finger protein 462-like [Hippocampus zosterae]|uniref:zinc finger protein 462-like n=1 Tax=Hippocampus zosterae TaxID=109293 RepID=UPI00223D7803|nr:zinc finger protein 462-like [Hippocampus zosterae]